MRVQPWAHGCFPRKNQLKSLPYRYQPSLPLSQGKTPQIAVHAAVPVPVIPRRRSIMYIIDYCLADLFHLPGVFVSLESKPWCYLIYTSQAIVFNTDSSQPPRPAPIPSPSTASTRCTTLSADPPTCLSNPPPVLTAPTFTTTTTYTTATTICSAVADKPPSRETSRLEKTSPRQNRLRAPLSAVKCGRRGWLF